jgi:hypothetical protein
MKSHDLALFEIEQIYAQAHARVGVAAAFFNTTMVLAVGLTIALGIFAIGDKPLDPTWYLIFAMPFWSLGLMIIREDLQMAAGDERFYEIRAHLRASFGDAERAALLRFPPAVKGGRLVPGYGYFAIYRYLVPILAPLACVGWYLRTPNLHLTWQGAFDGFLLAVSLLALGLLLWGAYRMVLASRRANEERERA